MVSLPVWCACGKIVKYAGLHRCEDCFASDQDKYDGQPTRVEVPHLSARQEAEIDRRTMYINEVFRTGRSNAFIPPNAVINHGRRAAR